MAEDALRRRSEARLAKFDAQPDALFPAPPPSARAFSALDAPTKRRAARWLAAMYPPGLELQQAQLLIRHGERTPLAHTFADPGIPARWPLCKDQPPPATAVAGGGGGYVEQLLVNPGTREVETLKLEAWTETPTGPNGALLRRTKDATQAPGTPARQPDAEGFCDLGVLTDVGRKSAFDLGVRLRKLYIDRLGLLPPRLDGSSPSSHAGSSADGTNPLYLRASPFSRTIETTLHAFQGLYPLPTRGSAPQALFHRTRRTENLYQSFGTCPRLYQLYQLFKASNAAWMRQHEHMLYLDRQLDALLPHALETAGIPPEKAARPRVGLHEGSLDPTRAMDVASAVSAHEGVWDGLKLPPELRDPKTRAILDTATSKHWFGMYQSSIETRRLGAGPLLTDLATNMVSRAEGNGVGAHMRLGLYGCHDSTIGMMAVSLGHPLEGWPRFTSVLAFELLRKTDEAETAARDRKRWALLRPKDKHAGYYVRVMLNNTPIVVPHCFQDGNHLPGNRSLCTLKAFKDIADNMLPPNRNEACELDPRDPLMKPFPVRPVVVGTLGKADRA